MLSDDSKKATYDATGRIPGQREQDAPPGSESDFFEQMFSFNAGGPGKGPAHFSQSAPPPKKRKGKQQTVPLEVTLEDLYALKTYNFNVKRKVLCKGCKGTGALPGAQQKECVQCQGYVSHWILPQPNVIQQTYFFFFQTQGQTRSQVAVGPGVMKSQWNVCHNCNGSGQRYRSRDKSVFFPLFLFYMEGCG